MPNFKVDTKLFRELGELLVGRETTALVEIIKNSYDADATKVAISGKHLSDPGRGEIVVSDDGIGMTKDQFESGFLTIAGRSKVEGQRRSPYFKRRYTGEKGIGRLAAHKLARRLHVVSRSWDEGKRDEVEGFRASSGVKAQINWDAVERFQTLAEVRGQDAINVESLERAKVVDEPAGTRIVLKGLRRKWTTKELNRFYDEVATLTPSAAMLSDVASRIASAPPLLKSIKVRDQRSQSSFQIQFLDEFALSEPDVTGAAESSSWLIEIDCDAPSRRIAMQVTPTIRFKSKFPDAAPFTVRRKISESAAAVSFQAKIFQRENVSWGSAFQGVRVYHEGFRVLPYGDTRDDWLELDREYRGRGRGEIGRLEKYTRWNLPPGDEREGLVKQGNNAFFGAVFLTREGAPTLQFLANREGFLPSEEFEFVAEMVGLAIDLQVRQRYAATSEIKGLQKDEKERQKTAAGNASVYEGPSAHLLSTLQTDMQRAVSAARKAVESGNTQRATAELSAAEKIAGESAAIFAGAANEGTMFRILASMGLEQAAFIHEVNALATLSQGVAQSLETIGEATEDARLQRRIRKVAQEARQILERLRRNAVYLADMTGIEGRRRRTRQSLKERVERSLDHFRESAAVRQVVIDNLVGDEIRTPPMFPAEVVAIFSNLLSNAIKFARKGGRVLITASEDDELAIRIENTGRSVDLKTAAQWFQPFRSTTSQVDQALGQGMGLGLTITRSLVEEYGGSIEFVRPSKSMATALEIRLPLK